VLAGTAAYDLHINMHQTQSTVYGSIIFTPAEGGTKVVWTDGGDAGKNIINRWMSLMTRITLGRGIDKGLIALKAGVEKDNQHSLSTSNNGTYLWKTGQVF